MALRGGGRRERPLVWFLHRRSLFSKLFVWGQYAAFGRADAQAARDYFSSGGQDDGTNLGHTVTTYVWGGGRMVDAWPVTPDENEYSLSIGVPVGLGIYLAWVNRDWSAKTKTTGFAAALGGALIGAWLGFNATSGFVVIVTAIVGAAVGANLVLILLDVQSRAGDAEPDGQVRPAANQ